jgi:hypothetical protein
LWPTFVQRLARRKAGPEESSVPEYIFDTFDENGPITVDIPYEKLGLAVLVMLVKEGDEGAIAYMTSEIEKEADQAHGQT